MVFTVISSTSNFFPLRTKWITKVTKLTNQPLPLPLVCIIQIHPMTSSTLTTFQTTTVCNQIYFQYKESVCKQSISPVNTCIWRGWTDGQSDLSIPISPFNFRWQGIINMSLTPLIIPIFSVDYDIVINPLFLHVFLQASPLFNVMILFFLTAKFKNSDLFNIGI